MEEPLDPRLIEKLKRLQQKYDAMGQDLGSYLDGLMHSEYLTYWNYIHLDTLLSLQTPKTNLPDEKVFIVYHQISELYFNLILWEIRQISEQDSLSEDFFCGRLTRIIRYFENLEHSFPIMTDGMEKDQFLKFRTSLLPASGFQSIQYRCIEIGSTDMINLVSEEDRESLSEYSDIALQLEKLYWRKGATELATGKRTLTLQQFEERYMDQLKSMGSTYRNTNLLRLYKRHFAGSERVVGLLRKYDRLANVLWPLAHLKSAGRYLHKDLEDLKATGGTNWQKFLPPRYQRIIFFPELWSGLEKEEWGKAGVLKAVEIN